MSFSQLRKLTSQQRKTWNSEFISRLLTVLFSTRKHLSVKGQIEQWVISYALLCGWNEFVAIVTATCEWIASVAQRKTDSSNCRLNWLPHALWSFSSRNMSMVLALTKRDRVKQSFAITLVRVLQVYSVREAKQTCIHDRKSVKCSIPTSW